MVFTQILTNSLIIGSIYALVAAGFSLIYSTNRFMHLAHGSSVAFAAYATFTFTKLLGLPFFAACLLTILTTAFFGVGMYRLIYRPLLKRNSSNVIMLIASVGLLILVENLILLFFGPQVKTISQGVTRAGLSIVGASITPLQILIVFLALLLFVVLWLCMKYTKLGMKMRAVADNKELASIVGIDAKRVADASFLIGSSLAGIAGILIGLEQNLEPTMGTSLIIKGFTGAIIGGITSVPGSILGSYLLGIAENFGVWYLPSGYKDAIAFGLLFIFLLVKPQGILGRKKRV